MVDINIVALIVVLFTIFLVVCYINERIEFH